ncbi:hypothetical protein [Pseudomonas sp. MH10]|uniref:hypothetical protein n=1 Tax=Pseudomonas sp. MH10 TaxID=3048627 RepID=UPI002B230508|nr:hypothetical protein [Pseudomonas sp. MH10]MEB0043715.1 hypothetical protein [Pseudomonas sp. MH10]
MAAYNSTQVLALLGKTVSLIERSGTFVTNATGTVTAVVVALPGADVGCSILVGSPSDSQFFDLDDCELTIH